MLHRCANPVFHAPATPRAWTLRRTDVVARTGTRSIATVVVRSSGSPSFTTTRWSGERVWRAMDGIEREQSNASRFLVATSTAMPFAEKWLGLGGLCSMSPRGLPDDCDE